MLITNEINNSTLTFFPTSSIIHIETQQGRTYTVSNSRVVGPDFNYLLVSPKQASALFNTLVSLIYESRSL